MLWQRIIDRMELSELSQGIFATYYVLFKSLSIYDTAPPTTANVFAEGLNRLSALIPDAENNYFLRELRQRWGTLAAHDIREARGERS